MISALLLVALPLFAGTQDEPDLLVLADGKPLECRVLFESDEKVVYRVRRKTQEVVRSEVKEIQSVERSLHEFLERFAACDPGNVAALTELALFAQDRYLAGEAHNTWLRILTLDPENEQAWTQLGGVKRRKGWELKVRGRFLDIEELRTRVSDWKNALELRTAHFLIKTDAAPEFALNLSIDAERAFLAFYDLLQEPLELYVFDELPEIRLYADPQDYPNPPSAGQDAWFSPTQNAIEVNAREGRDRGQILAEFADLLVFNAFRRTLDTRTGQLEPWAREGLRQAFAWAARPDPGRLRFEFGTPILDHFRAQVNDEKPLTLAQVLRAGRLSFDSGPDASRFVAGSYTLTYFLVHFEDARYRAGFGQFLRSSFEGKGGSSNLCKALGVDEKTLETQWRDYVRAVAGG